MPSGHLAVYTTLTDVTDLTMLIIEHDVDLAFEIADSITVLNYGQVVFDGTPEAARGSEMLREIYLGSWEDA